MSREQDLVQQFGSRGHELDALRELTGGVTATHARATPLRPEVFDAVVDGLGDENPRVRWWCLQILDHSPDERAIDAVVPLLDDAVPRVRRTAAHALSCVACKPAWSGRLSTSVLDKLDDLAAHDPNAKVRAEALHALCCHSLERASR